MFPQMFQFAAVNSMSRWPRANTNLNFISSSRGRWRPKFVWSFRTRWISSFRWPPHRNYIIIYWAWCWRCCCTHWHATKVHWPCKICLPCSVRWFSNSTIYCSTMNRTVVPICVCCCWSIAAPNCRQFDLRQLLLSICWCGRISKLAM